MADYFTNFSLLLPFKDDTEQKYAFDLATKAASHRWQDSETPAPDDLPAGFENVLEDWSFETDADGETNIWLHSSSGGIEAVCVFLQHLLRKFNPGGRVEFEWSHDCSKPRLDAYGGGAAVITAHKITAMNTSEWLRQQRAADEADYSQTATPKEVR